MYATTDRALAHAFAACWTKEPRRSGGGWLYQVEFADELVKHDAVFPCLTGMSYQDPRGRVVEVIQKGVRCQSKHARVFNRIMAEANRRAHEKAEAAEPEA